MFIILVLLSVPGGFRGEIATLKPAGERPGVAVGESVILQFGGLVESFPADVANMFMQILSSVLGHQVILKLEKCYIII